MSIAKVYSAQLIGLQTEIVTIEVDISNGLHSFSVIGLGDRAIEESKDRISAAIKNSGYVSPKQKNQKVIISLAPADVRKEGPSFDLAMAVAYLSAAGEVDFDPEKVLILGELSLEGYVKRVSGLLPILCQASTRGFDTVFIPTENSREASMARGLSTFCIDSLTALAAHLSGKQKVLPQESSEFHLPSKPVINVDMSSIRGNESAKRGLEIAAAGGHNILMSGPPGTGKTMLAQSFISILPPLTYEQSIEVTGIHSVARNIKDELIVYPPFRSPHHTASYPSIVGGGAIPKPGEITLAHRGVLFLDEFPEFDRNVLEALRQLLEERLITISRVRGTVTFPAQSILIAAMNPCPCGKGRDHGCTCPTNVFQSYQRRISGPILDRIDVSLQVNKVDYDQLGAKNVITETSETIRQRVSNARHIQKTRFDSKGINKSYNSEMSAEDIDNIIDMTGEARSVITISAKKYELSGRAFHRIIKVARTIADLSARDQVQKEDILEALQYRHKKD